MDKKKLDGLLYTRAHACKYVYIYIYKYISISILRLRSIFIYLFRFRILGDMKVKPLISAQSILSSPNPSPLEGMQVVHFQRNAGNGDEHLPQAFPLQIHSF